MREPASNKILFTISFQRWRISTQIFVTKKMLSLLFSKKRNYGIFVYKICYFFYSIQSIVSLILRTRIYYTSIDWLDMILYLCWCIAIVRLVFYSLNWCFHLFFPSHILKLSGMNNDCVDCLVPYARCKLQHFRVKLFQHTKYKTNEI